MRSDEPRMAQRGQGPAPPVERRRRRWTNAGSAGRTGIGWVFGIAAVAAALTVGFLAIRERAPVPAVVVLITVDTLRADFLGHARRFPTETPFLDRLAADGVVFDSAYAVSSWTAPSMASLFTSLSPSSHGVSGMWNETERSLEQQVLPASLTTLAECFQSAGYVTIGMPANLHLSHDLGFAQGFDYYAGQARFVDARRLNNKVRLAMTGAFGSQWRRVWKDYKTFLWIHYFDPHFPYFARRPWATQYSPDEASDLRGLPKTWPELQHRYPHPQPADAAQLIPLYASEISFFDEQLRRLSERLGLEGDNVLLIVTADHGEEFAEHGAFGHGQGLHEELVHVPLMIRWPAGIKGGRRIQEPVSLLDVFPTLLDLTGLAHPAGLSGESLAAVLRHGNASPPAAPVFSELLPPRGDAKAVRDGQWSLIRPNGGGSPQLFDRAADPREQRDLARENTDVARQLDDLLTQRAQRQPPPPPDTGAKIVHGPAVGERLRALGYLPEP